MAGANALGNTVWDKIYASGGYDKDPEPELMSLCKGLSEGKALDVGAGEGRHALWLAAHRWEVKAMDISIEGIARLRKQAEEHGLSVKCHVGSAAEQVFAHETYDLVLSTGSALNFFKKAEAKRKGHHVRSYELARLFVAKLPIADRQKALILKCILKHRSAFSGEDNEIEVKVLQSADALGVFFDEDWQAYSREVLQKDDLLDLYDQTFSKINLESAKNIARPQIDRLKNLLEDSIAPGGGM